ncbi:MAG: DNA recombination protein RmuC [Candidatus Coatesbacteria bacterium]|nr:MAG: DNA recombination protein RmuC [Candidatus Coatesbacteria bacterium]
MTGAEIAILAVAGAAVVLLAVLIWLTLRRKPPAGDPSLTLLQGEVQGLRNALDSRLDHFTSSFADVKEGMGELRERSRRLGELAADIASLEELLRAPKARGGLGELFLENLLGQVLPAESWGTQVDIGGKRADAVVRVGNKVVAIDAKFPVEDFRRLAEADEAEKPKLRKELITNLKKKAEDIAAKYIRPDVGTYDFALMYVPAEAVYYEAVADGDFFEHAARLRVFPVSPATTYLYLTTVAIGLKGLRIEEEAEQILGALARLEAEWNAFDNTFRVIGTHLRNLSGKYDEAAAELTRISGRLASISGKESEAEPADGLL